MTHHDSDLSELLDALRAGEMTDTIRTSLEWVIQQLIESDATAQIGAGVYERTEDRTAQRNGHRPRLAALVQELARSQPVGQLSDRAMWPTSKSYTAVAVACGLRVDDAVALNVSNRLAVHPPTRSPARRPTAPPCTGQIWLWRSLRSTRRGRRRTHGDAAHRAPHH